ncbi:hypothetical protein HOS33_gp038 [Erwinia phage vB_EamM_Y3]|uniref:Uncharacterized protein n=1 Tax=Erwinia phage vB_EamM_Y3 TaxID=1983553 RepID=A0A2H4IAW0_9CAUD|nr:hypothetical protein HOS33_gp038 [Erwinia phage vB_EamM_Y3]ARW58678.1 hypothetical protein Y3_038 [Erwinia phage vB_EamM_Y3]QZE55896.1 hypothetical protein pEaSNUABM52_00038 [Erwinia phage pEp_SNUABM_52]
MSQPDNPLAKFFDEEASFPGLDEAQDRVDAMRDGGGEALEDGEADCDGCKI